MLHMVRRLRVRPQPFTLTLFAGICACAFASTAARADAAADAAELFAHGRSLRNQGDCTGAIRLFREAYQLLPAGLGSLRNIAQCEQSLGHYASARQAWTELKRAVLASDDSKYSGWAQDADEAMAMLAPKVGLLTIEVTITSPVTAGGDAGPADGVDLTLNGELLAKGLLASAVQTLERDPGMYVIRLLGQHVSAPQQETIELEPGEARRVALRAIVLPDPAPTGSNPAPSTSEGALTTLTADGPPQPGPSKRTAGWIALGVGAAGLTGAAVSLVIRQGALDEVRRVCPNVPCDPSSQSAVESVVRRGHTASSLVNAFAAVGILGAVGGVALLAASPARRPGASLRISPAGLSATGSF